MAPNGIRIYKPNLYDSAGFISRNLFLYVWEFFFRHYGRKIKVGDLEICPMGSRSEKLGAKLEAEWNKERAKAKPSFLAAVHRAFGLKYAFLSIIIILNQCVFMILQTIFTGWLVRELANYNPDLDQDNVAKSKIYWYGFAVLAIQALIISTVHPYFFETFRLGMDIRISCCNLIYKKSLKLSKTALSKTTIGQIVNMLSNDVNRFDWVFSYPHYIFVGPICTIIVTVLLYYTEHFGNECLPGIAILLLYIPMQAVLGKVFTKLRIKTANLTDERVRITNEFVKAMKVIKMYSWEVPFTKLVDEKRRQEVEKIKIASYLRGVNLGLFFISTKIILFVMLFLFVWQKKHLTSESVFVAMGLINQLRTAVCLYVPYAISLGAEAMVSLKRIQEFLLLDEVDNNNEHNYLTHIENLSRPADKSSSKKSTELTKFNKIESKITAINMNCNYKHSTDLEDSKNDRIGNILTDINFDIKSGQLFTIIGQVGSGKSSILMAILNELPIISGSLSILGKISYASQEAWTIPGTIRDNILFGNIFDGDKYDTVIEVCALERDLSLMPDGDRTRVGDTGLSGGQRARVNLARALYNDADIYLLDDPLSAVDASVAKHIFDHAIKNYLSDKICILITHQLQFIKSCDKLLLLKGGKTEVYGTYEHLLSKSVDFMEFHKTNNQDLDLDKDSGSKLSRQESIISNIISSSGPPPSASSGTGIGTYKPILEGIPADKNQDEDQNQDKEIDSGLPVITPAPSAAGYRSYQRSLSRQSSTRASIRSRGSVISRQSLKSHRSRIGTITNREPRAIDIIRSPHPENPMSSYLPDDLDNEDDNATNYDEFENEEKFENLNGAPSKTYWTYISAGGGCLSLLLIIITMCGCQFIFTFSDWWLSKWTDYVEHHDNETLSALLSNPNITISPDLLLPCELDPLRPSVIGCYIEENLYIYLSQTLIVFALALIRTIVFFITCMRASVKLHDRLFKCLVRAPMSFFDNNPIGILLNRCSRDIGIIDDILPATFFDASSVLLVDLGSAILICFIDPWVIIPTAVLLFIFIYLRRIYVGTARNVKKLEGITRSPVFSHLATSLNGLTTIRATRSQSRFISMFDSHQDNHSAAWFHFLTCSRWFGITLDWLCVIYIGAIIISMLSNLSGSNGSAVGLAITSAILLSTGFQWGIRQATEVETQMTSVERVDEYSHLESEKYHEISFGANFNPITDIQNWPPSGNIEYKNVSLTYNINDGPVLRDLTFSISAKEKIGIVGRTGAGKSSIINSLFRLTEPEGVGIFIDGVDTRTIDLHDLRRKISIIPQEPVLFTGSIRKNLDPFDEIPDGKLWRALDEVQLRETVQDIPGGLNAQISEEQCPFSMGQRQLVCMARAIIRQNKILILDEATANIDPKTDSLIQETIRRSFSNCTILTIAHRLDTIIDADRVLVLDAGSVSEFDEPIVLLKNEKSIFSAMCRSTGSHMAARLKAMAQRAADVRRSKNLGYN